MPHARTWKRRNDEAHAELNTIAIAVLMLTGCGDDAPMAPSPVDSSFQPGAVVAASSTANQSATRTSGIGIETEPVGGVETGTVEPQNGPVVMNAVYTHNWDRLRLQDVRHAGDTFGFRHRIGFRMPEQSLNLRGYRLRPWRSGSGWFYLEDGTGAGPDANVYRPKNGNGKGTGHGWIKGDKHYEGAVFDQLPNATYVFSIQGEFCQGLGNDSCRSAEYRGP